MQKLYICLTFLAFYHFLRYNIIMFTFFRQWRLSMKQAFWDMIPGDELFYQISSLPEGRQKRFFTMIAEEALLYNRENETFFTFGEFKDIFYPDSSRKPSIYDEEDDREMPPNCFF